MKIAILQDHLRCGGTERQSLWLVRALDEAGMETVLVTFRPGGELAHEAIRFNRRENASPRWIRLQKKDTGFDWYAPRLTSTLRAVRPDFVLCMGRMANCMGPRILRKLPWTRVLATFRTGRKPPFLYRRCLRAAHAVVCNSAWAQRELISRYRLAPERTVVIPNPILGIPASSPAGSAAGLRAAAGADDATCVFLWVGMFRPDKNQEEIVRILQDLPADPPWQLWLVGDGATRRKIEAGVKDLRLQSRIRFFGYQEDPAPFYEAADAGVLTSRSESLSNFLIECQSSGLPVVAYDRFGNRECFDDGISGFLVPDGDSVAFRARLREWIEKPAVRLEMGARARETSRRFDPSVALGRYLELLERLEAGAPGVAGGR